MRIEAKIIDMAALGNKTFSTRVVGEGAFEVSVVDGMPIFNVFEDDGTVAFTGVLPHGADLKVAGELRGGTVKEIDKNQVLSQEYIIK